MLDHGSLRAGALVPVLCLLVAAPARAQTSAGLLKSALRTVAAAQARHRAERGTYAATVQPLKLRLEPGVGVEVLAASAHGWQGRAVHREHPGKSCVIFVGRIEGVEAPRTDGDRDMPGEDGVPLCDRMR